MQNYEVTHISGKPDWKNIPTINLTHHLWSNVPTIIPSAQAAWDEDALYIRMQAMEPHIRREYTGDLDPVCQDSCLEFFFCPTADNSRYFNFEVNPNGSMYVGYGKAGNDRCRLHRPNFKELFQVSPFEFSGGWGIELRIPVSFLQIFVPDFKLYSGLTFRANFYKCGDLTQQEHYIAWNPIDWPHPCYHLPQFFGEITLK